MASTPKLSFRYEDKLEVLERPLLESAPNTKRTALGELLGSLNLASEKQKELLQWIQSPLVRKPWEEYLGTLEEAEFSSGPDIDIATEMVMTRLFLGDEELRGYSASGQNTTNQCVQFIVSIIEACKEDDCLLSGVQDTRDACQMIYRILQYLKGEKAADIDVMSLDPNMGGKYIAKEQSPLRQHRFLQPLRPLRPLLPKPGPVNRDPIGHPYPINRSFVRSSNSVEKWSSCQECRRRKKRCNRMDPCAYCETYGISCVYTGPMTRRRRFRAS